MVFSSPRSFCFPGQAEKDLVHGGGGILLHQLFRAIQRFDAAIDHDRDAVAILGFVHIVGGDEDGDAAVGGRIDQAPELPPGDGVDAAGGFVEEDDGRVVDDGDGKGKLLLPPERQGATRVIPVLFQLELLKEGRCFVADRAVVEPIDAGIEADILPDGEVFVKGEFLAHVADVSFDLLRFMIDVDSRRQCCAGGRQGKAAKHAHGGRFTRAVGAEEAEDLAFPDVERDIVDGDEFAKTFGQMGGGDDG